MNDSSQDLNMVEANYKPLNPVSFLEKAADIYPNKTSIIYNDLKYTWQETYERCKKFASSLKKTGLKKGEVVGIVATNTPELYEAHFAVPMAGLVLNALNYRLDAKNIAYIIDHSEIRILFVDTEFSIVVKEAISLSKIKPPIIDIEDLKDQDVFGIESYENFINKGDSTYDYYEPENEWENISINYTSGTTGLPKGVVYHYRGAYLNALGNIIEWNMENHPIYLWTLPMFHCNGWCFPWTLAAKVGTNICIRKVTALNIYNLIFKHKVNYLCGAPIVLSMIVNASEEEKKPLSHICKIMTAAAPPPAKILQSMKEIGFDVTHVYGLTEVFGPCVVCKWKDEWDELSNEDQAELKSRQGKEYLLQDKIKVVYQNTMKEVPKDGVTIGEVLIKGNITMKGYLKDEVSTKNAFRNGWFHTGDLGVIQKDGYLQLKDRAKDIIISGGENISSIEIENCLYTFPSVESCAVVSFPDEKWGEIPCAFIEIKQGYKSTEKEIIDFCKKNLAGFKVPKKIIFQQIPKTSTGKIQKVVLRNSLKK